MVGWHHQLNGHEFEQALGDGEGQGSLACCIPWGLKESDMTEQLNNSNKNLWDLIPQPGIKPMPPHWKHVFSHWTTMEVPNLIFLKHHWLQ